MTRQRGKNGDADTRFRVFIWHLTMINRDKEKAGFNPLHYYCYLSLHLRYFGK